MKEEVWTWIRIYTTIIVGFIIGALWYWTVAKEKVADLLDERCGVVCAPHVGDDDGERCRCAGVAGWEAVGGEK